MREAKKGLFGLLPLFASAAAVSLIMGSALGLAPALPPFNFAFEDTHTYPFPPVVSVPFKHESYPAFEELTGTPKKSMLRKPEIPHRYPYLNP